MSAKDVMQCILMIIGIFMASIGIVDLFYYFYFKGLVWFNPYFSVLLIVCGVGLFVTMIVSLLRD